MKKQEIRTFGRRHGKRLSIRKQDLLDNLLPAISPKNIKKAGESFILEVGFGNGEHVRELATTYPDNIIIGAKTFMNGVAALLSAVTNESENVLFDEYKNIRIWSDDVRKILNDESEDFIDIKFNQIWVLHPDPWPKARHEKRRLLNPDFLNLLSERLNDNGQIIIGTDHHEYYDWIVDGLKDTNLKIDTTDLDIIKTRYMQKNKAGTDAPKYLVLSNK